MQNGNNDKKVSRLIPVALLVALIGVVGAAIFFLQSAAGRSARNQKNAAVKTAPAPVGINSKLAAEIAALEQKLGDLDKNRIEIGKQYFLARKEQQQAKTREDLLKDLQEAQHAVAEAIDNNPQIVAEKQEMARLMNENVETGMQQAKALTAFHAVEKNRDVAERTNSAAIWQQSLQERKQVLGDRKDWSKMTPEENEKFMAIQEKYVKMAKAVMAEWGNRTGLSPAEQQDVDEFTTLGKKQQANTEKYAKIFNGMALERARVMREDPQIAALCQKVIEKQARLTASVEAAPELAGYRTKLQELERQMVETSRLLGQLKRQTIGTSAAETSPDKTGKNS